MEGNVLVRKNSAVTPHCIHYIVNIIVTVYCIDILLLLITLIFQCYLYRVMCTDLLNEVVIVHLEINQMTPSWLCVATKMTNNKTWIETHETNQIQTKT